MARWNAAFGDQEVIANLGFVLLCIACFVAFTHALLPWVRHTPSATERKKLALLELITITGAFLCLIVLRVRDDFSVLNVADHSNRTLPLLYKITGTWGNHEGSMLLWVLVLSIFAWAMARKCTNDSPLMHYACSIQAALSAGFLLFIILTSNPFERLFPVPSDGSEMNPLLQDIGIVMHPPLLYIGYVGFSSVFSMAIAALLQGQIGSEWARIAKPFLMTAWSSLTIGIGLGSWWAYRELGWGGWWFWDPVENASLLPWLAGTALLHCNVSLEKRGVFKHWVLLLAILTFALSLLGTFLVRSGVLTSVHSFASDPARGMFILGYMAVSVGGALLVYSLKVAQINHTERAELVSREGMILVNNLFLITTCLTILFGTLYPLLAEFMSGAKVTVGPPYYQYTALPLMVMPILLAGIAPLLPWKGGGIAPLKKRLLPTILASITAGVLVISISHTHAVLAAAGFGMSTWLATLSVLTFRRNRLLGSDEKHRAWPVFLAHLGVAILVAGITAEGLWAKQAEAELSPGEHIQIGNYQATLESQTLYRSPNFMAKRADISLKDAQGNHLAWLAPEFRFYPISGNTTSESAILSRPWSDVYVVVGQSRTPETAAVRVYVKPGMQWIWAGFLFMTLGGLASIATRKRKVFS